MINRIGKLLFAHIAHLRSYCSTSGLFKMSAEMNGGVPLNKVISALEHFAPKALAEGWDNTGLLVEPYTERNVTKILLTNDLTEDVALEAVSNGCEMIISYHPPIFAPLKSVVQSSWKERIVALLLEKRISLYSPHTSWDYVKEGVSDWLASAFTVVESAPITLGVDPSTGARRLLHLKSGIPLADAVSSVKKLTGLQHVRLAIAKGKGMQDTVSKIALCAGSGSSVLKGVAGDLYLAHSRSYFSTSGLFKMSAEMNGGVPLNKVISALEHFAPKALAEGWDNTGLLVEPYTMRNVTKILLTNDLTEDVALEAVSNGCEMIISYHLPIFAPLKSVVRRSRKERIVALLLRKRISLYSPHTSWDCVKGGVNDWLASAFTVVESAPITPGADPSTGAGRLLHLKSGIPLADAVSSVKKLTGLQHVRLAIAKGKGMQDTVSKIALCAGSGSSVLKGVAADLYLTGEMLHHDVLDAAQKGISVILTNHSDSERGFLRVFSSNLQSRLDNQVDVLVSNVDKDPLITV